MRDRAEPSLPAESKRRKLIRRDGKSFHRAHKLSEQKDQGDGSQTRGKRTKIERVGVKKDTSKTDVASGSSRRPHPVRLRSHHVTTRDESTTTASEHGLPHPGEHPVLKEVKESRDGEEEVTPRADKSEVDIPIGTTHQVDFSERGYVKDPNIANACVTVLTSDGERGTLSHKMVSANARLFARDLRQTVGKDGVPVCLSGGCSSFAPSRKFVPELIEALGQEGFLVSRDPEHSDLMGEFSRRAILYPDKVIVMRRTYGDNQPYIPVQLTFPTNSNTLEETE